MFTDAYAQASCTAGRAAFITGQIPMRTGLTTVGKPGALQGIQAGRPVRRRALRQGRQQTITDTGALTRERMTTIENDLLARSLDFMGRAHEAGKPFLPWHNSARMHVWTRLPRGTDRPGRTTEGSRSMMMVSSLVAVTS
jgi:arylsulfatase A-like enzyme